MVSGLQVCTRLSKLVVVTRCYYIATYNDQKKPRPLLYHKPIWTTTMVIVPQTAVPPKRWYKTRSKWQSPKPVPSQNCGSCKLLGVQTSMSTTLLGSPQLNHEAPTIWELLKRMFSCYNRGSGYHQLGCSTEWWLRIFLVTSTIRDRYVTQFIVQYVAHPGWRGGSKPVGSIL